MSVPIKDLVAHSNFHYSILACRARNKIETTEEFQDFGFLQDV
jgi:hypothetical protein